MMVMRYQRIACKHVRDGRSKLDGTFAGSRTRGASFGGSSLFRQDEGVWSPRQESNLGYCFRRTTRRIHCDEEKDLGPTSELGGESSHHGTPHNRRRVRESNPCRLVSETSDLRVCPVRLSEPRGRRRSRTPRLLRGRALLSRQPRLPAGSSSHPRRWECVFETRRVRWARGICNVLLRTKAHQEQTPHKW